MNPVVFILIRIDLNNFENSVDELQEFCTDVQIQYYRYGTRVPVQIPEYNESILTLWHAW